MLISIKPLMVKKKKTIDVNYSPYPMMGFTNGNSIDLTSNIGLGTHICNAQKYFQTFVPIS